MKTRNYNHFSFAHKSIDGEDEKKRKQSIARAGGRNRSRESNNNNTSSNQSNMNGIIELGKKVIPLLVIFAILKGFLGSLLGWGYGGTGNVVYYQSTVYESRTYDTDGKMERIRKESVKSNIPSMINGNKEEGVTSSYYLDRNLDKELDRVYQDSIRKSMIINEFDY